MKTPQQIRNEVEKGCGKVTNWYELKRLCGTFEDLKHSEHIILCPSCQAKLSILTEYDKSIKEMIEERVNFYKKLWLKAVDEQNKHQEDIFYNTYFNLKELLSKINSEQPRFKQTRGGELKSDEGLHSTDNGSPADTFSKEDSKNICICGHHTIDHSYDPNKLDADLECDICDCKRFRTKEDRSFLGGYAEFWDNPEDNRWDKEEEKQDD